MQRQSKRPRQNLFDNRALLDTVVENQDIIQALRNFNFRRKNKKWEEKLNPAADLDLKICRCNFHNSARLPRPRIARHIERIFETAEHKKPKIMVRRGFVPNVKRQFDKNRLDAAGQAFHRFARQRVPNVALAERKRGQKTHIDKLPDFQIGHDSEVETWACDRFSTAKRVVQDEIFGVINPKITAVVPQSDTKIIWFRLKIEVVLVAATVILGFQILGKK